MTGSQDFNDSQDRGHGISPFAPILSPPTFLVPPPFPIEITQRVYLATGGGHPGPLAYKRIRGATLKADMDGLERLVTKNRFQHTCYTSSRTKLITQGHEEQG